MMVAAVYELVVAGRAAHPDVEVTAEMLARFVTLPVDAARAGDLYLACGCLHRVPRAADRLERLHIATVPRMIAPIDRAPAFVAEVQQRLREKLLVGRRDGRPKIGDYAGRGSLAGWIRVAAIREALYIKRRPSREVSEDAAPDAVVEADVELQLLRRTHEPQFARALRGAMLALEPRERSALRLSYLDDLSIDEIARIYGVHRATAARWITRALIRVRELTASAVQETLELSPSEADSLIRDIAHDGLPTGMLTSGMLSSGVLHGWMRPATSPPAA
jgi:RNA polymerase sigma-70 factor, ECF subfamily